MSLILHTSIETIYSLQKPLATNEIIIIDTWDELQSHVTKKSLTFILCRLFPNRNTLNLYITLGSVILQKKRIRACDHNIKLVSSLLNYTLDGAQNSLNLKNMKNALKYAWCNYYCLWPKMNHKQPHQQNCKVFKTCTHHPINLSLFWHHHPSIHLTCGFWNCLLPSLLGSPKNNKCRRVKMTYHGQIIKVAKS